MLAHLDTDFLITALIERGPEWRRLSELTWSEAEIQISAVAWYEFSRGPRTPERLAVARSFFLEGGIVPFSEELATRAADVFRQLGSPRRPRGHCHRRDGRGDGSGAAHPQFE